MGDIKKQTGRQGRTGHGPQCRGHRAVEQIGRHRIRPRPGPGEPPPGTPAQHQQSQRQGEAIALQPDHRVAGTRLIQRHRTHIRTQQQRQQTRYPEALPPDPRLQTYPQPEIRKKDDAAAQRKGPPDPSDLPRQTPRRHSRRQHQPFSTAPPQKHRTRSQPPAQTQQIPQHPPGGVPGPMAHHHRDGLTQQIQREDPLQLPQTARRVLQKKPRQKGEQGHMEQIDIPVKPVQHRVRPDLGLDEVAEDHQKDEKQLQIAVIGIP